MGAAAAKAKRSHPGVCSSGTQIIPRVLGEDPLDCGIGEAHDYIVFLREKPYISYEFFEEKERGFSYEDFSVFSFLLGDLFNKGARSVVI